MFAGIADLYRGVITERMIENGETYYKVSYQVFGTDVENWVERSLLTVDNIGDPIEMTRGRPIVYADGLGIDDLPPSDRDYPVRKCLVCKFYFRDVNEHMRSVHGMNANQIFDAEVEYSSTPPPRERKFFRFHSTPVPNRRSRFFDE